MADGVLFLEGFETDTTASVWENCITDHITADHARSGGMGLGAINNLGVEANQGPLFAPTVNVVFGFAFRWRDAHDSLNYIWEVRGPGDVSHVSLGLNGQNCLQVAWQGGGAAYTNFALDMNTWYYIELRCYINRTNGYIELRVNGADAGEQYLLVGPVNTASGDASQWFANQFHCGSVSGFGRNFSFDDIYVRDATFGFMGDLEILGAQLVDDFSIEWTRNTEDHNYKCVYELTPDEDTSYVETEVEAKDLYEVGDTTYAGEIVAVQLVSRGRKTSTQLWSIQNKLSVGGLELTGAKHYMGFPNYETFPPDVFGTQPNGDPWDVAAFNAMKVGFTAKPETLVP